MADELIAIADAVVVELNASGRWSLPFKAERRYDPEQELDVFQPNDLHVTVVAGGRNRAGASRGKSQLDYPVGVLFQQKLLPADDDAKAPSMEDQCDPLMALVQQVADWFDTDGGQPLTTFKGATFTGSVNDPAYDQKSLHDDGLFASLLVMTFRAWRAKR